MGVKGQPAAFLQKKFNEVFIDTLAFLFPVETYGFGSFFSRYGNGQIYQGEFVLAETAADLIAFLLAFIIISHSRKLLPHFNNIFLKEISNV